MKGNLLLTAIFAVILLTIGLPRLLITQATLPLTKNAETNENTTVSSKYYLFEDLGPLYIEIEKKEDRFQFSYGFEYKKQQLTFGEFGLSTALLAIEPETSISASKILRSSLISQNLYTPCTVVRGKTKETLLLVFLDNEKIKFYYLEYNTKSYKVRQITG